MNLFLTLTFCLILSINEAFLLPREVNFGKALDDDPKQRYVMPKNAQEELEFLMTLVQAFKSHQKFVDLLDSLMKSKPQSVSEELNTGPFTLEAWLRTRFGY